MWREALLRLYGWVARQMQGPMQAAHRVGAGHGVVKNGARIWSRLTEPLISVGAYDGSAHALGLVTRHPRCRRLIPACLADTPCGRRDSLRESEKPALNAVGRSRVKVAAGGSRGRSRKEEP